MKIVATIPARLGSKRVQRKNLRLINNEQPMVWYAINAAIQANTIDTVYVNSESAVIGNIGLNEGAEFYQRDERLAEDSVSSDEFNYDFMKNVDADIVVMVNPVAPLVTHQDIDSMVRYFLENDLDTLIPVKEESLHTFCDAEALNFDPNNQVMSLCRAQPVNFDSNGPLPMTQHNSKLKICVWTVCIWRRETFMKAYEETGAGVFSGKVGFYPQHPITSIKVSNEEDFRFAEVLLRYDYHWKYPKVVYDSEAKPGSYPTMWMNEIEYIEQLLLDQSREKKHLNIVEWGSGASTVYFSEFLKKNGISFNWHAIENFYPWYDRVTDMIEASNVAAEAQLHLKSKTFEDRKDVQEATDMTEFIEFPKTIGSKFDIALVDARQRDRCLEVAAEVLQDDGVAIMHDAERVKYHWAFKFFDGGGDFVVENSSPVPGGVQKLWVGRLPAS